MKMQIKKSGTQFYFNVVATNGQVLTTSERYVHKADAKSAAESIKRNAGTATIEDDTV